jgi:ferredoxin
MLYLHLVPMVKIFSLAALFLLVLFLFPSCKKCYTCVNACSVCTLRDTSTGIILKQQTLYSDSNHYLTLRGVLLDSGYVCVKGKSTYSIDFCVNNKKGEDQYLYYYEGNGSYSCTPK